MAIGEREESQQQQQQRPLAPSFQTEPTQVAPDDLNNQRRDELEVSQPQKESILQKVKETAKTLLQIGNDHGEKEDHQQFEDEKDHDHSRQEVKEDTEGLKKETAQDLNSNFKEKEDTEDSICEDSISVLYEHLRCLWVLNTKHCGKLQLLCCGVWKYMQQRRKKGKRGVGVG